MSFAKKKATLLSKGYVIKSFDDCNKITETGIYKGVDVKNSPYDGAVELIAMKNSNVWTAQDICSSGDNTSVRSINANVWSRWVEIYDNIDKDEDLELLLKELIDRIARLEEEHRRDMESLESVIRDILNATITGHDVIVIAKETEKSLQQAIDDGDFCECASKKKAICGTFLSGELNVGQDLDRGGKY